MNNIQKIKTKASDLIVDDLTVVTNLNDAKAPLRSLEITYFFNDESEEIDSTTIYIPFEKWQPIAERLMPWATWSDARQGFQIDRLEEYFDTQSDTHQQKEWTDFESLEDFVPWVLDEFIAKDILLRVVGVYDTDLETIADHEREYARYKDIIRGRGREIAKRAGIHYNTFTNYVQGDGSRLETWAAIVGAARDVMSDLKKQIELINI